MGQGPKRAKAKVEAKLSVGRKSPRNNGAMVRDLEKRLAEALQREAEGLKRERSHRHRTWPRPRSFASSAGDLPVEQPTKFNLAINLKTAKALGHDPTVAAGAGGPGHRVDCHRLLA